MTYIHFPGTYCDLNPSVHPQIESLAWCKWEGDFQRKGESLQRVHRFMSPCRRSHTDTETQQCSRFYTWRAETYGPRQTQHFHAGLHTLTHVQLQHKSYFCLNSYCMSFKRGGGEPCGPSFNNEAIWEQRHKEMERRERKEWMNGRL